MIHKIHNALISADRTHVFQVRPAISLIGLFFVAARRKEWAFAYIRKIAIRVDNQIMVDVDPVLLRIVPQRHGKMGINGFTHRDYLYVTIDSNARAVASKHSWVAWEMELHHGAPQMELEVWGHYYGNPFELEYANA